MDVWRRARASVHRPRRRGGSRCPDARRRGRWAAPCAQRVPVGGQSRAGVVVDGGGDRLGRRLPPQSVRTMAPTVGSCNHEVELRDGGLDEPGHRGAPVACAFLVALRHRGEHVGQAAQPRQVALAPLLGVERDLGQRAQHVADRRRERVADGELDRAAPWRRRPCRGPGSARSRASAARSPSRPSSGVCSARVAMDSSVRCVARLGLAAEVGQSVVVAGKAEERPVKGSASRTDVKQLGSEFVSGHRGRLARTHRPAGLDQARSHGRPCVRPAVPRTDIACACDWFTEDARRTPAASAVSGLSRRRRPVPRGWRAGARRPRPCCGRR